MSDDNVIPFPHRADDTPLDDALMSLPRCPITACSRCGRTDGGWISKSLGCQACAPENEAATLEMSHHASRASVFKEELENLLVAARAVTKSVTVKVSDVRQLRRVVDLIDDNERRVPLRTTDAQPNRNVQKGTDR